MPRLGGLTLASGSQQIVYTAPQNKRATVTLNLVNTTAIGADITVGFVPSGSSSMTPNDYIEYRTNLAPGNIIERTGITPFSGESIIVLSNQSGVSVVVWGYTE